MKSTERVVPIGTLFSEEAVFEQVVLDIHNEADRREVIEIIADELMQGDLRVRLNFAYLKALDDLNTAEVPKAIFKRVVSEAAGYLEERHKLTKAKTSELIHITANLLFLKRLSLFYYKRFGKLIYERVADTIFEQMATLPSPDAPPAALSQVFEGGKKHPPLLKGGIAYFSQVWDNAARALDLRKKEMGKIQVGMHSILNILETNDQLDEAGRNKLKERYRWNQERLEALRQRPLSEFNASLKRLKAEAVQSLYDL